MSTSNLLFQGLNLNLFISSDQHLSKHYNVERQRLLFWEPCWVPVHDESYQGRFLSLFSTKVCMRVCVRMLNPKVLNCSELALTWGGLVYGLGKLITVPFWWNVFLLRLHGKLIFCCCCCFCSSNFEDLQKLCEQHEHFHPCENKSIDCAEIVSYHQDSSTDHTRQMHAIYKQLLV